MSSKTINYTDGFPSSWLKLCLLAYHQTDESEVWLVEVMDRRGENITCGLGEIQLFSMKSVFFKGLERVTKMASHDLLIKKKNVEIHLF